MKAAIVILAVLLILALIVGGAYVGRRNQMAIKREAVNAAWAQVDVVLQRRADLLAGEPRLGLDELDLVAVRISYVDRQAKLTIMQFVEEFDFGGF